MSGDPVIRIGADASGAKSGLAEAVAANRLAVAQIQADSQRASARDRTAATGDAAMRRQLQRQEYQDRVRTVADKRRVDEAAAAARTRLDAAAVANAAKSERDRTNNAEQNSRLRMTLADREAGRVAAAQRQSVTVTAAAERQRTTIAVAEARNRERRVIAAEREERARNTATGREAGGRVAQAVEQVATDAHGRIQAARETMAERTSALNTQLVQRGTSREENAIDNARIQARLAEVRTGVAPEVGLAAIAKAQSFANALGGDTREQRAAGVEATLRDVELAGAIDPTNVTGIVNMGAILRRRVADPAMQQRILRGAVGTSFEGSVETDQMVTAGLPGLLRAISSGTANTAPADRDRVTAEIAQDFFAQLQAQAAGGRTVGVAANRTNTVRDALRNANREGRMGLAMAEQARNGTPEQQAAFRAAFTKDDRTGVYSMNRALTDTPSNAARFFGTMFNNDAGAMRNGLGTNGLGGRRQLMNIPDVDAIASYFGMTTGRNGEQIREYDHVEQLKQASLTPEQERVMAETRAGEDRTRLMREREAAMARDRQPGFFTRASDSIRTFATENPVSALLGGMLATPALAAAGKAAGGAATGTVGAAGTGVGIVGAVLSRALMTFGHGDEALASGSAGGEAIGTGGRVARVGANVGATFLSPITSRIDALINAINGVPTGTALALAQRPLVATVTPQAAAHATTEGGSSRNMPPTPAP